MSAPRDNLALLRRIARGADTAADRAALAERVRAYLDSAAEGVSLDAAFGLSRPVGGLPWWRVQALASRDAALRTLAERFYGDLPVSRQAVAIRSALVRYGDSAWRLDGREAEPPRRYVGSEREILFDVMRACPEVPSARQIRRILTPCALAIQSGF